MSREGQLFSPRPGQKLRTTFLAKLGEIVNVGSEGGPSKAPLPSQQRGARDPIALMTAAV